MGDPKAAVEVAPGADQADADAKPAPVPAVAPDETVAPAIKPADPGDAMSAPEQQTSDPKAAVEVAAGVEQADADAKPATPPVVAPDETVAPVVKPAEPCDAISAPA